MSNKKSRHPRSIKPKINLKMQLFSFLTFFKIRKPIKFCSNAIDIKRLLRFYTIILPELLTYK